MTEFKFSYETRSLIVGIILLVLVGLASEPVKNFKPVNTIKRAVLEPEKFSGVKFFRLGEIIEPAEVTPTKNEEIIRSPKSSPLGVNFQVNKCSGYLNQFLTFAPPLAPPVGGCPKPDLSALAPTLPANQVCLEFIATIPACTTPLEFPRRNGEQASTLSPNCQNFIKEEFNYNACFDTHRHDPDFLLPEWRVYE